MGKQRLPQYDNCKGILILLVVIGHVLSYANPDWDIKVYTYLHAFITGFHMQAFFLLSGMLFNADKWQRRGRAAFLLQRTKTLLIPFLFFELLGILYNHFVLGTVSIFEGLCLTMTLRCNIGADWFLPAMFVSNLLFYTSICCLPRNKTGKAMLAVFAMLSLFSPQVLPKGLFLDTLIRGLLGFSFMVAGYLFRTLLNTHSSLKIAISMMLTFVFAGLTLKYARNDFFECSVSDPLLLLFCGLTGLYCTLGIAKMIHWRPLTWLGENSIVVMGSHQIVLYTAHSSTSLLWVLKIFAVILGIEVALIWLLNRICPVLIGKPSEKRKKHETT